MPESEPFVTRVVPRLTRDGKIGELAVHRKNGTTAYLHFPMEDAGAFALGVEHAVGALIGRQRKLIKGADPRLFFAMKPRRARLQGGRADGKPVLSITLETGARLDVAVKESDIAALVAWLERLAEPPAPPRGRKAPH
jgi:hypothetical protein